MMCRHWGRYRWALAALLLLAWALRMSPMLANRLHPDEALYGYWGLLIAHGRDPWLARVPVYKPPLLPYLLAGVQAAFGSSEFSLRLPGLAASLLSIPLVAALARSLYGNRWTATAAAAAVALSPFSILFSPTAFIDPLMVTLGLGACLAAARGRAGWAGALAGLSFAAKQTGLMWLPLVILLQFMRRQSESLNLKNGIVASAACFSLVVGLTFAWDAVRVAQGAKSFWRVGAAGYGGLRLIWPHELWARLHEWIGMTRYLFASPILNAVLLVGLPALTWRACRRYGRESLADLILLSFVLVYLLLHWLAAFPTWDRYLLPLAPVLALLLGRILNLALSRLQRIVRRPPFALGLLSLILFLGWPALSAAHSRYPIGGDNAAYEGLDQVVAFLRDLPEGSVVYQHWLGWQYAYYLFDGPAYLAYWPTPAWLAQDIAAFGATDARYITFPAWESSARVERALSDVGYGLEPALVAARSDGATSFTVYHIRPLTVEQ